MSRSPPPTTSRWAPRSRVAAAGAIIAVALVLVRLRGRAETRAVLRVPYLILALQIAFAAVAFTLFLFARGPGL